MTTINGVADIRSLFAANPGWNALECLEGTGFTPTTLQINNATAGGLNDPEIIASIPEQIEWRQRELWRMFPAYIPRLSDVVASVDLRASDKLVIRPASDGWIRIAAGGSDAMALLGSMVFSPVHAVVEVYREVFRRDPDPAGLAFWLKVFDGGSWTKDAIETEFWNSPEAQALADQG